jgi:acetyl-CoA carboxylase biotin carboxyl carrier protein
MSHLPLTPEDVNSIVAALDGSGYDRLDIKTDRYRLRVVRDGGGWTQDWDFADADAPVATKFSAAVEAVPEGLVAIAAPLPGTFYRAPQPGAPPFVEVGARVEPDTVIGIIETMKLMNPVHAGVTGNIATILTDNATMIESGAALMHVRPA